MGLRVGLVPVHSFSLRCPASHIKVQFIGISARGRCLSELNAIQVAALVRGCESISSIDLWCYSQQPLMTAATRSDCLFGMDLLRRTTASGFHMEHTTMSRWESSMSPFDTAPQCLLADYAQGCVDHSINLRSSMTASTLDLQARRTSLFKGIFGITISITAHTPRKQIFDGEHHVL